MTTADTLRARYLPAWKTNADLAGIETMLETTLSFIDAPKAMKARIAKAGTLNALGIAQAMRGELSKDVVPELRRIRRVVNERREAVKQQRAALAQVKVDPNDLPAALLRQEMRTYLRGRNDGERMKVLIDNPDKRMVQAALEAPDALSGLTAETRPQVQEAYMRANHSASLKSLDDQDEALALLDAAARIAITEIRSNVEMGQLQFDDWFATAGGREGQRAA